MLDDAALTLIARYVSGECTAGELANVERWIAEDPARAGTAERLRQLWQEGAQLGAADAAAALEWDVDAAWQRFAAGATRPTPTLRLMPVAPRDSVRRRWIRVALGAAAALVVVVPALRLWHAADAGSPAQRAAAPAPAAREFATAPAQRAQIRLSDGTLAVLAPGSRLRMPAGYGVAGRELELEGQAYFEVRHDPAHPFRVRTAHGLVEDIGTKFGVRAYPADSSELVAVTEGAVLLRAPVPSLPAAKLVAGQIGTRRSSGTPSVQTVADVERYVAWTQGRLVFRNAPLADVARQLSRWYAIDIRLADPGLGALVFTGSFRDESVAEVLQSLEIALDIRVQRSGDSVTLRLNPSRR